MIRSNRLLTHAVLFCAAVVTAAPVWADDVPSMKKLDRALRSAVIAGDASDQPVIIRAKAGQLANVRAWLSAKNVTIEREIPGLDSIVARLSIKDVGALAARLESATLSFNGPVNGFAAPNKNTPPGVPAATSLRSTLGLTSTSPTGKGVGIAVIDSGIQPSTDFEGRFAAFYDWVGNGGKFAAAYDDYGHGTHVAGLIASNGALGSPYTGVAPDAKLVGMKVLDANGAGRTSDVISAIMFAIANKSVLGIDVINLSLGHPIWEAAATDPLVQAVEAASRAGIIVVTAAGNFGVNMSTGLPGYAGITSPGNAPSALTVGAFDHKNTVGRDDDRLAPYSSSGPTWYDGLVKPDIVAPGHHLGSNATTRETLYAANPTLRLDSNHLMLSGTSMASAVAAGAVAVILQANRTANSYPLRPSLTPNAVKGIVQYTALPMHDASGNAYDALRQGSGALNVGGAIELARSIDTSTPVGAWWLASGVSTSTTIDGVSLAWAQNIVWGSNIVWGTTVFWNAPQWALNIVWGSIATEGDNIVWGTMATESDNIVWGTMATESDNIVWGTNIVWGSNLLGTTDGMNIVWGSAGPTATSTAWGSLSASNIVWGTNIVWSSANTQ